MSADWFSVSGLIAFGPPRRPISGQGREGAPGRFWPGAPALSSHESLV